MLMDFDKGKDLYTILGCDELSNSEQICTEYKQKIRAVHPDKKPNDEEARMKYEELRHAYDILSNDETRKKYDTWKRSGLAVPFHVWMSLNKTSHTGQHWALRPKKERMITCDSHCSNEIKNPQDEETCHISVVCHHKDLSRNETEDPQSSRKRRCVTDSKFQFGKSGFGNLRSKFRKYEL